MTTILARRTHVNRGLGSVRVEEAMHPGLISCRANASVGAVARVLAGHRIHAVVLEDGEGGWKVVTDLDLAGAIADRELADTSAAAISKTTPVFVDPDETLERAVEILAERGAHQLVVLGRSSHRPVGVVSTLDIANVFAELAPPGRPETEEDHHDEHV